MKSLLQFLGAVLVFAALAGGGYYGLELLSRSADEAPPERAPEPEESTRAAALESSEQRAAQAPATHAEESPDKDWATLNNEGVRALENDEAERAVELFEQCVEGEPDEPLFRRNLANALIALALEWRAEGPVCEECLELLERALELEPEREDLAGLVERWRTEAEVQRGFWEESSLYFDLSYDGSRTEILRDSYRVMNHLDEMYAELRDLFGYDPVREGRPRIPVVLYARGEFGEVTGLGDWAGGAFDGTVRIPLGEGVSLDDARLQSVLKHEVTHAFVHATGGKHVPGWLNEGLAQWLEPQASATVPLARERLAGVELFALSKLSGSLAAWKDPQLISLAYAQSLAFTDFIARQYGERVLFRMVGGCREGVSPDETFRPLVGIDLETALADFVASL